MYVLISWSPQKGALLEEQGTNAIMGGLEDTFGEEEALQCVEEN